MARNKHPEETVNRILEVSFRLFMEKGYEHTSIQDIIDHLGGLSKGAIYHHFRSKEEILLAVTNRMSEGTNQILAQIRDRTDLCGRDKLKMIFKESVRRPVQEKYFAVAPDMGGSPRLMADILMETMREAAPDYIFPILEQGIADGSVKTEYPLELAELIMLTANFWINPMIFEDSGEKSFRKFMVFGQMMRGLGLDVVDDEILERLQELTAIYQKHR